MMTINHRDLIDIARPETPEMLIARLRKASIVTHFVYPPIPIRIFDWAATRGDFDLGCLVGSGATEQEAIDDLLEQEDSR